LRNLNAKILDPLTIGMTIERGYDCVSDVYERDPNSKNYDNPLIMENKFHFLDMFYPFEVERALNFQYKNPEIFKYESLHLNMFTTIAFIKETFKNHMGKVFEFRVKEKAAGDGSTQFSDHIPWVCKQFSFEINAYNLMRLTNKTLVIKRDRKNTIMIPETGNGSFNSQV
jgi:hypothetical protein